MNGLAADRVLRVGAAHSMAGTGEVHRAVAVRGTKIVAVSPDPHGLDGLVGAATRVMDDPDLTLLPAFCDAHEHLLESAKNTALVPVGQARSIAEFTAAVGRAAAAAAEGQWVQTSIAWHESNLAEGRLPTRVELDAASPDHPVLARRGGHLPVANSAALAAAGITAATPDPPGGAIGHGDDGQLNGVLESAAVYRVLGHMPPAAPEALIQGLRQASAAYAALGVGTIREALISVEELGVYQAAWEATALRVRVRPLIRVPNDVGADAAIALVEGLGVHSGFGDDWLRLWGLKLVPDGGVEGGATDKPYANDPANRGHLNWDPEVMLQVCVAAARRGWRIGTHAVGDRAVQVVLDVYERVTTELGGLAPATLVVEHALLADPAQQARAVRLGVGVTVQHALLWNMASEMLTTWGPERTARVNPIDQWLDAGAILAAGTDIVRPFNPMTNVWGMVTRGTNSAGIQGPEHAIDRPTAVELYTTAGARLDREEQRRGTLTTGRLADIVAYPADPFRIDLEHWPISHPPSPWSAAGPSTTWTGCSEPDQPSEDAMDEQARQQAFVSALVTEHFVLQSARSTTVTEANGRAAIYLTSVSSALVAFGFVAQVANQLDPFMAAVLPALFVLGVFTFIRLVENSIENLVFLEQIQRIRGYYAGLVPEARAFFASGTRMPPGSPAGAGADGTDQGEMATALASTGVGASRVEMLFTAASMVGAVNSILGGAGIALLVRWAASIDTAGAVLVGVVATLVVFGLHLVWESRRGDAALGWRAEGRRGRGRPQ